MAQLSQLVQYLGKTLNINDFKDSAYNGLQVNAGNNVDRIAFAVDAGLSVLQKAVTLGAQLLIVHHGILWRTEAVQPITGPFGEKIRFMIEHSLSLYGCHLPLDGHPKYGNGAQLARFIGLNKITGYCEYDGQTIGAAGHYPTPLSLAEISSRLSKLEGHARSLILPHGPKKIRRVAIVTGSGSFAISAAAKDGFDLLVSGEPKQSAYHESKEHGINVIFAGHYATETVGVRALMPLLQKHFKVKTSYIAEPTGI